MLGAENILIAYPIVRVAFSEENKQICWNQKWNANIYLDASQDLDSKQKAWMFLIR